MSTVHSDLDIRGQFHSNILNSGHNIQGVSRKNVLCRLKSLIARGKYSHTDSCHFRNHSKHKEKINYHGHQCYCGHDRVW